jgi:hypothetical protein
MTCFICVPMSAVPDALNVAQKDDIREEEACPPLPEPSQRRCRGTLRSNRRVWVHRGELPFTYKFLKYGINRDAILGGWDTTSSHSFFRGVPEDDSWGWYGMLQRAWPRSFAAWDGAVLVEGWMKVGRGRACHSGRTWQQRQPDYRVDP